MSLNTLVIGFCTLVVSFQVHASETLLGGYTGKITAIDGYPGALNDTCAVTVSASDQFGGSLVFEVNGFDKALFETRNVEKALMEKSEYTKILSPGAKGKPSELLILKVSDAGALLSVKLKLSWPSQHQEKSVGCGYLSRTK
jgi:hypothetical protein